MAHEHRHKKSLSRSEWTALWFFFGISLLVWLFGEQLATALLYTPGDGIQDQAMFLRYEVVLLTLITALVALIAYVITVHIRLAEKPKPTITREAVSDIMLSREQFRQLYENSPVPYFLMDDAGNIRHPNIASLRFFGGTMEEVASANLYDLIADDQKAQQTLSMMRAKVERALPISREEMSMFGLDKRTEHRALVSIYSLSRKSPIPFKHLVTIIDVTKERESEQIKTDFLLLASHQLRTPLTTVKWYIDYLLTTKTVTIEDEVREYLEQIYIGNERMIELITTLLTVSRIEMGTLAPEYTTVHVNGVVKDILEELASEVQKHNLEIKAESKGDDAIVTDHTMIRIAIHNLLTNAIKYTPVGGTVSIVADYQPQVCTVTVTDTGYGIPPDEQEKIFTKMFRASNARKVSTNGTGLGLFLTKSFVEKLGGSLAFSSELDKGTTFTITVPRVAPDA